MKTCHKKYIQKTTIEHFSPFVGASWGCTWWSPIFSTWHWEKCGYQVNIAGSSACWRACKDPRFHDTSTTSTCGWRSLLQDQRWPEGGDGWLVVTAARRKLPSCSKAAKLARPKKIPTTGPGKRVSTSLCTFAAQISSNTLHFHCKSGGQRWKQVGSRRWPFKR